MKLHRNTSTRFKNEFIDVQKKRGFKYVGPVTIYSHLRREASPLGQACGIINDHDKECPCWQKIVNDYPTVNKRRDHEVK